VEGSKDPARVVLVDLDEGGCWRVAPQGRCYMPEYAGAGPHVPCDLPDTKRRSATEVKGPKTAILEPGDQLSEYRIAVRWANVLEHEGAVDEIASR
jgi:hypothetical protein